MKAQIILAGILLSALFIIVGFHYYYLDQDRHNDLMSHTKGMTPVQITEYLEAHEK